MSLTGNFGAVTLHDKTLTATGASGATPDDGELVSRYVAIHQDGLEPAKGSATLVSAWKAEGLAATGFAPGDALAVGVETYFTANTNALPAFVTFTWSQKVNIEEV